MPPARRFTENEAREIGDALIKARPVLWISKQNVQWKLLEVRYSAGRTLLFGLWKAALARRGIVREYEQD